MSSRSKKEGEHAFSIELKSKEYVKRVSIPNETGDNVLIEGFLGELEELGLVEGVMLKIKGASGILRMDLQEKELKELLPKRRCKSHSRRQSDEFLDRRKGEKEAIQ